MSSWGSLSPGLMEFFQRVNSTNLLPEGQMSKGQHATRGKKRGLLGPSSDVCTVLLNFLVLRPTSHLPFPPSPRLPCSSKEQTGSRLFRITLICFLACGFLNLYHPKIVKISFANVSLFSSLIMRMYLSFYYHFIGI